MGFYGHKTNGYKTSLDIKITYTDQHAMEQDVNNATIAIGDYVLVNSDKTVWQKTYVEASKKFQYIKLADVDNIVPTFDLIVDAPGDEPSAPKFGPQSTNVHYKLHVQPSWGFRVAEVKEGELSDVKTADGKHLDIYFNNNGFDPKASQSKDNSRENYIKIESAQSGTIYGKDDNNPGEAADDIKEIKISLPAIGNAVSEVYDLIYGSNRDNQQPSMQGYIDFFTNLPQNQIPVASNDKTIIGVDVGTLPLTGLNLEEEIKDEDINIAATDSINTAFVKVTKQFANTDTSIQGVITEFTDEIAATNSRIDKQANWDQEDVNADDYIKNKPDLIVKTTKFTYEKNDNIKFDHFGDNKSEDFDLQALYVKVWNLEKRIQELEANNNSNI